MQKYIWLVPLLPLIGAAINGLLGRKFRFSEKLIGGIAVGSVALSFLISVAAVYSYGFGGHPEWPHPYLTSQDGFSFDWIPGGAVSVNQGAHDAATGEAPRFALLNIEWSYQLDPLSSIFMLIVTGVGLCIFVFATGYMHGETDRGYARVVQDCRGRFASEGEYRAFIDDMDDGYDTVEWIAAQPWSNGKVGMIGGSALGITANHGAMSGAPFS